MATKVFGLLTLAVCIMLAASTPTDLVRRDRSTVEFHDVLYFLDGLLFSIQAISNEFNGTEIEEEFNVPEDKVNVAVAMCQIVAYYHLVKAVDNSSNILYYLKQNALDALTYWNTTYCSDECTDVNLLQFGRKCQRAALFTLMRQIKSTFVPLAGNYPGLCEWLKRLLQQQKLQGMYTCSQLVFGPFNCADC